MAKHDFSQLPVVTTEGVVSGMVTASSIVRASNSFKVAPAQLGVRDAREGATKMFLDQDIEELLDETKNTYAVVITDRESKVVGIVTTYDTTDFFRRRAGDMMLVEDIETMLKEYVEAAYFVKPGEKGGMGETIEAVSNPARQMRPKFESALMSYLGKSRTEPCALDAPTVDVAFKRLGVPDRKKAFDELTMAEFAEMLLLHPMCPKIAQSDDKEVIRRLLSDVRETRNKLAHFRGELSPTEREQLRFCKDWLEIVCAADAHPEPPKELGQIVTSAARGSASQVTEPTDEEARPTDSILVPLISYLQALPPGQKEVRIRLQDIEKNITKCKLPKAAHEHRSWWANEPENLRSAQWLEIGWRVLYFVPNAFQGGKEIVFVRIGGREKSYINFFNGVRQRLAKHKEFPLRVGEPDGRSYFRLADLPNASKKKIGLFASFTKSKELRVELYVDYGKRKWNKAVYDKLFRNQTDIDGKLGLLKSDEVLRWERMDDKRACRIAIYRAGSIQQSAADLKTLSEWVVASAIKLEKAISPSLKEA